MDESQLRVLVIVAHPDDADLMFGGTALLYTALGHEVTFLSCTNGDTGHHEIGGIELASRRYSEAQAAASIAGLKEYRILDIHSGELEPSVHNRKVIIRTIREVRPHVIFTHRPNDYHPDHRYTSQLVQDASYIVTVPNMLSLTPALDYLPVIFYLYDQFCKPYPFAADVVVGIDEVIEAKLSMIHCHDSQMYEWLPYNQGKLSQVPDDPEERREWLRDQRMGKFSHIAEKYRNLLVRLYGAEKGKRWRYAEAFEACEYGRGFSPEQIHELFPFFQ